ncbi:CDP-glycerol glycerophosphotransferase (TagB/SpsB family)/glycosyltransferase involved in cell wall biosynthesis [Streptacidiphilus sp. MAP12-20]|uniref:bifunctional glycosyltransferase/CDP-glycerol:glycerophosphate glycerophosphotransferase n=1 Tax=Streptacidiphilus sp. MAP12-20 TaxID=3156299 RepID=UPI003516F042
MPRISVVVPVYQVQAYLGECLESVLGQSFRDIEVIAVDDCSPDGSGAILDGFAQADDRVRVLHLAENVGLGRARNAGMELATGDYLLFLDSDDTLTPGSLQAVADRLDATGDPEVLIYDYARTYWDGREVRSRDAELFAPADDRPEVFAIGEREEVLGLLMVVWNKVYRSDFVAKHAFRFPPGYYEDTPWTYPVLLAARTVAMLDRVVVHYRQRRQGGNILATVSRKHFDIFEQYDRVFVFVDAHPALDHWRPLLHRRMAEHLRTIGNHPDRVPAAARKEFFERAAEAELRHRPADVAAIELRGSWKAGPLGQAARKAKHVARAAQPELKRAVAGPLLGGYQRIQRRLPIEDDLAVFASYWARTPACNPAAIHAKLRELAPELRTVWVVEAKRRGEVSKGLDCVSPGSRAYREAISRARYFVNNVNFPDGAPKRRGTVQLQTHHGTPVKKMGLDLRDYPAAGQAIDFRKLLGRVDRWDYSLSSNRYSTLIWERVYPSSFRSLEYGYPRNDVYYSAGAEEVRAARRELGIPEGATVLLYAPTLRDYRASYRPQLDLHRFAERLGEGHVVLNRAHYLYDQGKRSDGPGGGQVIDVSTHPSLERLALAADALVTDYSSVMFDYANLDRPIVVFADDWEVYRQTRGVYLDLLSGRPGETPGPVATTEAELVDVFRSGAWCDGESAGLRAAFRERFCEFDDGRAAERVVRTVFLGESEPLPVVPLAERTPAPSPQAASRVAASQLAV